MSVWTHVAGIIRVDGFRLNESDPEPNWDELIGKELNWDDDSEVREVREIRKNYHKCSEEFMPCGSEGSLKKVIWKNPDKNSLASYTVSVFGDLRDYDDLVKIEKWFTKVCSKLWVRDAVITADCELGSRFTAHWDETKEKLVGN